MDGSSARNQSRHGADFVVDIPVPSPDYAAPWSLRRFVRLARSFGPAAVLASLSLGVGETIMVTGLGAWAEYGLLWLLLLSVVVKGVFVTYLIGRYTAVTGQPIVHRLVGLPGPRGWLPLAIVVAEVGLLSMAYTAVGKPCGNLLTHIFRGSLEGTLSFSTWENLWTTLFVGLAVTVGLLSSYRTLERQQILICGVLVAGTAIASLIVVPDVSRLLLGAVSFGSFPATPNWAPTAARQDYSLNLVTVFGYVGGGLSAYLAYSSWVTLKGWGMNSHPHIERIRARAGRAPRVDYLPDQPGPARRMHVLLTPLRWDVGMGALVLGLVTVAFMTAGAVVLYPREQSLPGGPFDLLTRQAGIWEQLHAALVPVYYVIVIAALWGTLASVPDAVSRVAHDTFSSIWPRFATVSRRRLQALIAGWFFSTSLVWTWTGVTFDVLTQIGAFATANLGLCVVTFCALYFNATLPRYYRPARWVLVGGGIAAVILLVCSTGGAIGLWRKLS
jgi:hypothetical protein